MPIKDLFRADINEQIEELYQNYLTLTETEQSVLIILSVIYKNISLQKFDAVVKLLHLEGLLAQPRAAYRLSEEQQKKLVARQFIESNTSGIQINKLLANRVTADIGRLKSAYSTSPGNKLIKIILIAEQILPVVNAYSWQNTKADRQRVIRDLVVLGKTQKLESSLVINQNPQIVDHSQNKILLEILFAPFELDKFLQLPKAVQYQAFASYFRECQAGGYLPDYAIGLLEQVCQANPNKDDDTYNLDCHHLLAEQYLYQLRFAEFTQIIDTKDDSCYGLQLLGAYYFLQGDNAQALFHFELALKAKNKIARRKSQYLHEVLGYFHKLALIINGNSQDMASFTEAQQQIESEDKDSKISSDFTSLSLSLGRTITCVSSGAEYAYPVKYNSISEQSDFFVHHLSYFNYVLAQVWCNKSKDPEIFKLAKRAKTKFAKINYSLFARLSGQLAASIEDKKARKHPQLFDISEQVKTKAQWDVALDKLIALSPKKAGSTSPEQSSPAKPYRMVWELKHDYIPSIQAREQKLNKSGGWSRGRVIPLKRLYEEPESFSYLDDSDKKICALIEAQQGWGYYAKPEYFLQGKRALQAVVGIDNLYKENELDQPIELFEREPELLVTKQGDQLCLSIPDLSIDVDDYADANADDYTDEDPSNHYSIRAINASQYQLTVFSPEHLKVASIIGEGGLVIPISAKQKALDGITAIAPLLNIQSDITELDTGLDTYTCDPHLIVNIQPSQNGLIFTCLVMPFGEDGPAYKPGIGSASLSTDIKGKRMATQRNLVREQELLDRLDEACPAFLAMSDNVLSLDELDAALTTLEQLEAATALANFDLLLRWPKGKKISLSKKLESQHLQLALNKKSEWFDISGELQVDNEQVIELRRLLSLIGTSNGRYIELDANKILVLSEDLRQKLAAIDHVTTDGQFHPLASLQIEEATAGMRMKTIHAWDQQTAKMHEANAIEPSIPSTFQGELRDYQIQGFDWASRLAHWGAGACLADDMGLGKTMQALAVMLARAEHGPSLVIAPTSVCLNWQQEALRFTPTLNIRLFADANTTLNRTDLLKSLSPHDCVIISYGLLQRESEILKAVEWNTIVADEAQALKNPVAKRTKAAYALKGDFKMITTGTPIENDLTELWSLFRFINPGLLGNLKAFGKRFALPIENAKEDKLAAHAASQGLKTLIQPFILRRMKNQVLTELPPRTEINVQVEMSEKEHAFYEALRLNAIDNISEVTKKGQQSNVGEQRIRMLAELVKLRQACCNPKLVIAETDIPSAKLAALDELLEELTLNNHKALIFSQFVGHLQLIKSHIESKGISYQYLDGSTPQKERQKRVNAFQSGEGDVFLISLKAGGSGLNLTAADYVIHMDPWWNPAVEEQASDRAHRMGQQRPVTIYRLITQNTIEEKIVALHQHKRDLADKLLSGNETVTKLSVDDMLNLLKKTF
jgi:SNF2 family DNA or RNA helicase